MVLSISFYWILIPTCLCSHSLPHLSFVSSILPMPLRIRLMVLSISFHWILIPICLALTISPFFLRFLPIPHLAFMTPQLTSSLFFLTFPLTLPGYHQTLSIYLSCLVELCTQHLIFLSSSFSSVLRDLSLSMHCVTTPLDCSSFHPSTTSPSSSYLYLLPICSPYMSIS